MVGELDVAIAGQDATVEFLGDHILFRFASYSAASVVMKQPTPNLNLIGRLLRFSEIGLKAQIGKRKPIELFPKPSWIVRWLNPALRELLAQNV